MRRSTSSSLCVSALHSGIFGTTLRFVSVAYVKDSCYLRWSGLLHTPKTARAVGSVVSVSALDWYTLQAKNGQSVADEGRKRLSTPALVVLSKLADRQNELLVLCEA